MSKVIEFDPCDFENDKRSKNSFAAKAFIDLPSGSTEVWEVGGGARSRTLLVSDTTLQKYTDYVFRFGMTGGTDISRKASVQIMIFPRNDFNKGYAYITEESRFKPVISKCFNSELLRVFELPFGTGSFDSWRIVLICERVPARFFKADNIKSFASLEDMTAVEWRSIQNRRPSMWDEDEGDPLADYFSDKFDAAEEDLRSLKDFLRRAEESAVFSFFDDDD